jgi:hypothetical protein
MTPEEMIKTYSEMRSVGMLEQIRWQYSDMAKGGDGGRLHYKPSDWDGDHPEGPTCREYNYPYKTDSFFQQVCKGMNW